MLELPTSPLTPSGPAMAARLLSPASQLALRVLRTPPPARNTRASTVDASSELGRLSVVSWLVELAEAYARHPQTLHLALAYFDGFFATGAGPRRLAQRTQRRTQRLQLTATACFLLATKMVERIVPEVAEISFLTAGNCSRNDILAAELVVCNALNFSLCLPTSVDAVPHLCELAAGVVAMDVEELSRRRRFGRRLERAASFEEIADLASNEELDEEGMEQQTDNLPDRQPAMAKKALAVRLQKSAMAFADVALHTQGIAEQYSVGEVAAACVLLARCDVEGSECLRKEWLPIFDRARLNYEDMVGVAVVILHTWHKLCLIRASFPASASCLPNGDDVGSPLSSPIPENDLSFSTGAQHEFAEKLQAILDVLPSSCAQRVIAAGVSEYNVSLAMLDRKLPHFETSSDRNAYVTITHASVLWNCEIRPRAILDTLYSLLLVKGHASAAAATSTATVPTATGDDHLMTKQALRCLAYNFLATSPRVVAPNAKRALRARKSICKFAQVPGGKENCFVLKSAEISHHSRAVVPAGRGGELRSASAPAVERLLRVGTSLILADGATSAKLYR